MCISAERHHHGSDQDEVRCQVTDIVRSVIEQRENRSEAYHYGCENDSAYDCESSHCIGLLLGTFEFARTKDVTHHYAYSFTHSKESHAHEIPEGGFDVDRSYRYKTPV